ncbi:succinate dehydrogenase, cytochrome b556 subunit [Labedella phragmitis]|uniref:Succinate dehydrogenase, cytochrome b556 subunit n=2 Tax=Labedella phragmitis TaxID=2498849 RepID=A0A3S3YW16_9MICO|nr:succinate dehydrogenase, cytochrome b556 subunit [Labedella phragmitis]
MGGRFVSVKTVGTPEQSREPELSTTTSRRPAGTLYRGREGMWSWVLHRITGVAIFFFLLVHVLDTALVRVSPEAYNAVIGTYQTPVMGLGEVALVGAIVFHAFNGIRIILIDFWSKGTVYQRAMFYVVIGLWVITMIGFVPRHLINVFSH